MYWEQWDSPDTGTFVFYRKADGEALGAVKREKRKYKCFFSSGNHNPFGCIGYRKTEQAAKLLVEAVVALELGI